MFKFKLIDTKYIAGDSWYVKYQIKEIDAPEVAEPTTYEQIVHSDKAGKATKSELIDLSWGKNAPGPWESVEDF